MKIPRMKILLAGGSGFIGKAIFQSLASQSLATGGHEVVVLTRNPSALDVGAWPTVRAVRWDAVRVEDWISEVDGADAVINLTGEPLDGKRWRYWQKHTILSSRVDATRALVYAIQHATNKPSVLVNASGAGYYGNVEEGDVTESHEKGKGFLPNVCEKWEEAASDAEKWGVRVVLLRFGVVLGKEGGALRKMTSPFKLYAGGWLGTGKQWLPWVHLDDVSNIVSYVIKEKITGPVNVAAPDPATMKQFCDALGRAMHRPSWAPVPGFVLKLALGEMADMVLTGQRIVSAKLLHNGYSFQYPTLDGALADIFS